LVFQTKINKKFECVFGVTKNGEKKNQFKINIGNQKKKKKKSLKKKKIPKEI